VGNRLRAQTIPGKRKPAPTKEEYDMSEPESWSEFTLDYYQLKREADAFLSEHALAHKPTGIPDSPNFMTDELLGYWEADDGVGAELATGVMLGGRMMGVTFPLVFLGSDMAQPNPRNKCCWSWAEVRSALGYGDGTP